MSQSATARPPPPKKAPHAVREREAPPSPILEEHLRDPAYFTPLPGDTVAGPPLRHSDFWKSPDGTFQAAVHDLTRQIQASLATSDPDRPAAGPDLSKPGSDPSTPKRSKRGSDRRSPAAEKPTPGPAPASPEVDRRSPDGQRQLSDAES